MSNTIKKVGFVATGDELVEGVILNTNGQYFSRQLFDASIQTGRQVVVGDNIPEIKNAISYLLTDHQALIISGGLGPTADDKTRFALAQALDLELVHSPLAWQWILEMLSHKDLAIPDNNRLQALLPQDAEAIFNPHGTACACYIRHQECDIFMLPGPPNECRPIFDEVILPRLIQQNYPRAFYRRSWLLYGVSEGCIAAQLEATLKDFSRCDLGYRVQYPYLEVKLNSTDPAQLNEAVAIVEAAFHDKIVSHQQEWASKQLVDFIRQSKLKIKITDHATGGTLQNSLLFPETYPNLDFATRFQNTEVDISIHLGGLEQYWQNITTEQYTYLQLNFTDKNGSFSKNYKLPLRERRTLSAATELTCRELLAYLPSKNLPH